MKKSPLSIAERYYAAMNDKEMGTMEKLLHPDVHFLGPMAEIHGIESVRGAIRGFTTAFERLAIRSKFENGDQAMLAIDTRFPEPVGNLRTASLLTVQDGRITKIELFYDSQIVESKKEQVFADS